MNKKIKALACAVLAASLVGAVGAAANAAVVNRPVTYGENVFVGAAAIRQGNRGDTVKRIQQKLKRWGYYSGKVDGVFGAATKKAVKSFQRKNGLSADGIVGAITLAALGLSGGGTSSKGSSYTSSDTQLLARLIHAEARGETYSGKVAVGAVVLNRVKSPSFPNTISGVIYQPYAFTCVSDGQIGLSPDASALSAAKDAMNGWDPSYGSLYYYNPSVATSKWIFSRKTVVTIGKHVFAL